MLNGKRIIVVLPAYNAEKTLEMTYREIPGEFVDDVGFHNNYFRSIENSYLNTPRAFDLCIVKASRDEYIRHITSGHQGSHRTQRIEWSKPSVR